MLTAGVVAINYYYYYYYYSKADKLLRKLQRQKKSRLSSSANTGKEKLQQIYCSVLCPKLRETLLPFSSSHLQKICRDCVVSYFFVHGHVKEKHIYGLVHYVALGENKSSQFFIRVKRPFMYCRMKIRTDMQETSYFSNL